MGCKTLYTRNHLKQLFLLQWRFTNYGHGILQTVLLMPVQHRKHTENCSSSFWQTSCLIYSLLLLLLLFWKLVWISRIHITGAVVYKKHKLELEIFHSHKEPRQSQIKIGQLKKEKWDSKKIITKTLHSVLHKLIFILFFFWNNTQCTNVKCTAQHMQIFRISSKVIKISKGIF